MDTKKSTTARLIGGHVSFDHAADTYDATRALPDEVARRLTDALMAELAAAGADRVLEIGAGTGRIARPLAERGVRVIGVDISPRMLARLREQLGPQHVAPGLTLGDATRLPLASDSFRAVLVVHVLHLVSSWQRALEELQRVLAPGGVFIEATHRYLGESVWQASAEKWEELRRARGFDERQRPGRERIHDFLRGLGGSLRTVTFAEEEERRTPRENLERIGSRIDSWTWQYPDGLFAECLAELKAWYPSHYNNLDRELTEHLTYELEVWSFA